MEIILLQDVEKVGLRGDVVTVADGYARNFLIPRRYAERATEAKVNELRKREEQRARQEARTVEEAKQIAERLAAAELRFDVPAGPTGRLFGSVTPTNVADELWRTLKIRIDRRRIGLPETLKRIGRYQVPIEVFEDVVVEVRTLVVPEGGELPPEEELAALEAEERAAEEAALAAEREEAAESEVALGEALAEAEEAEEPEEPVALAAKEAAPEESAGDAQPEPEPEE
ncbi:MAG: 50S ribosomal protein L9 [Thermoleophilia bacterium]|nr:50S ribosomal protein L9 [Thermoleophilia bacterium]